MDHDKLSSAIHMIDSLFILKVPSAVLPDGSRCFKAKVHCIMADEGPPLDERGGGIVLFSSVFPHLSHVFDLGRMESAHTDSECRSTLVRFRACFGLLWVIALSSCPNTRLNLIQYDSPDGNGPSKVGIRFTECSEGCDSFVAVALILPYTCLQCGVWAPTMRKCELCWQRAGVCVRYCSKKCQREHYPKHRIACGCAQHG